MSRRPKLGILASHPIQYQAPIFRELAQRADLRVFFAHRQTAAGQADAGFGVPFEWDVDLLEAYAHEFLPNVAAKPDTGRFFGCDTPAISEKIARSDFDAFLVMGWNLKSYWQAVRACRSAGVPVMVRGDSRLGTPRGLVKRLAKEALYPWLLRRFDACLFVGELNRRYLLQYGVAADRLFFSPHCVDNARFAAAAAACDTRALRQELGIAEDHRVVLFAGKLTDVKRPFDLLEALALLKREPKPVHGLFVGDGPLMPGLKARATALNVPVTFAGFWNQASLPRAYTLADVLAMPSTSETWGLVINEALACGLPVVVSEGVGCAPDLVRQTATGATFSVGDVPALAAAIRDVLSTPRDEAAMANLIAEYSPARAAEGILAAVEQVQSDRGKGRRG